MRKKLLTVIIVAIMIITSSSLFACKKSSTKYDPDNFLTAEEAAALGTPYKIVKESITIKVFVPRCSSNPHYSEMKMFQKQ